MGSGEVELGTTDLERSAKGMAHKGQGRMVARFWRRRTTLLDVMQDLPDGVGVGDVRRRPQRLPATGHHMTGLTENLNRVMSISKTRLIRAAQERSSRHARGGFRRLMSGRTRMPVTVRVWPALALCPAGDDVSSER